MSSDTLGRLDMLSLRDTLASLPAVMKVNGNAGWYHTSTSWV